MESFLLTEDKSQAEKEAFFYISRGEYHYIIHTHDFNKMYYAGSGVLVNVILEVKGVGRGLRSNQVN